MKTDFSYENQYKEKITLFDLVGNFLNIMTHPNGSKVRTQERPLDRNHGELLPEKINSKEGATNFRHVFTNYSIKKQIRVLQ